MTLSLDNLIPMQRAVRDHRQIVTMTEYVRDGGIFDADSLAAYSKQTGIRMSPLIPVETFEDGLQFARDGHHRLVSILLAGRDFLYDSEYLIVLRTYQQYSEINLAVGWVTPFDPRTEIRKEDLSAWKNLVAQEKLREGATTHDVIKFIRANRSAYSETRGVISRIGDIQFAPTSA